MTADREQTRPQKFLTQAVEDLTAAGYLVLGPENAEECAALLGMMAFEDEPRELLVKFEYRHRAETLLAAFPESFLSDKP